MAPHTTRILGQTLQLALGPPWKPLHLVSTESPAGRGANQIVPQHPQWSPSLCLLKSGRHRPQRGAGEGAQRRGPPPQSDSLSL